MHKKGEPRAGLPSKVRLISEIEGHTGRDRFGLVACNDVVVGIATAYAVAVGRSPAATITSTGAPCQKKLAASMIMSDLSGPIQSGSGLEAVGHPQNPGLPNVEALELNTIESEAQWKGLDYRW
jgi:hypothetical protein